VQLADYDGPLKKVVARSPGPLKDEGHVQRPRHYKPARKRWQTPQLKVIRLFEQDQLSCFEVERCNQFRAGYVRQGTAALAFASPGPGERAHDLLHGPS